MKVNINRPAEHIKRKRRKEWHEVFAWTWRKVDCTDEGHAVVWFEKYMRRERQGASNSPKHDGLYWQQYSTKEYFKKKLAGDFDKEERDGDVGGRGAMGQGRPLSIDVTSSVIKKGGPYDNNKYKKGIAKSGLILSMDTKEEKEEEL